MLDVLAVDLGGTQVRFARVDDEGRLSERSAERTPVDAPTPARLIAAVKERAIAVQEVVFAVPGRVDHAKGRLDVAPNLPSSWGFDERELSDALGVRVSLVNDADLAAVGEAWFGAARGHRDVVFVTMSTGVGAGVLLNGRLVRGRWSVGEIGHTVIDRAAWRDGRPCTVEQLGSGSALGALGGGPAVVQAARDGDPAAKRALAEVIEATGLGLRTLAYLFSPEVVVVGGGLGRVPEVQVGLRLLLEREGPPGLPNRVVEAALGDDAGLVGAAAWRYAS